jgi:hypothetical protein
LVVPQDVRHGCREILAGLAKPSLNTGTQRLLGSDTGCSGQPARPFYQRKIQTHWTNRLTRGNPGEYEHPEHTPVATIPAR